MYVRIVDRCICVEWTDCVCMVDRCVYICLYSGQVCMCRVDRCVCMVDRCVYVVYSGQACMCVYVCIVNSCVCIYVYSRCVHVYNGQVCMPVCV